VQNSKDNRLKQLIEGIRSDGIIEWMLLLAFVGIPLSQSWSAFGIHITTTSLLFAALLLFWFVGVVVRQRRWHELIPSSPAKGFEWLLLAFVISCAVSLVWAQSLLLWGKEMAQIVLSIAIYTMVRSSALRRITVKQYWLIILCLTGMVALAGMVQYVLGWSPSGYYFQLVNGRTRPYLTFGDPNNLAGYLVAAVPLSIAAIAGPPKLKMAGIIVFTVVIGCLVCISSRASWIGAIIGGGCLLFMLRRRALLPLATGAVITTLVFFAYNADVQRQGTVSNLGKLDGVDTTGRSQESVILTRGTDAYRITLLKISMEMLKDKLPLGVGLGNGGLAMVPYVSRPDTPAAFRVDYQSKGIDMTLHNSPIQLLVELGILGIVPLCAFIMFFYEGYRIFRRSPGIARDLSSALLGACAAMLATNMFGWLFTRGQAELFFVLAGLLVAVGRVCNTTAYVTEPQ